MQVIQLPLTSIPQFSKRDKAYIDEIEQLSSFYSYPVSIDAFEKVIQDKKKDQVDRSLLADTIEAQYQSIETSAAVSHNIDLLRDENTFTVITAHQPSLMTGPGYYFYKIFSTLNLVQRLSREYKNYRFVPVFITGGEDHDFEEVNHFTLYGKELTWETDQKGSVGKFTLDQGFNEVYDQLMEIIGDRESSQAFKSDLARIRSVSDNYADFAVRLTNLLFKKQGLVVVDMSARPFKEAFIPYIKREIFEQVSVSKVETAQSDLEALDLKAQAMARPINFFYTGSGDRLRIDRQDDQYIVIDSDITFSKEELEKEIDQHPERFSPNVIMRPVFQEFIFPNLAYIGGGGEIAYWLERKAQFEAFGVNFPMLIRRNSGMVIDAGSKKKMTKLGLTLEQLFCDTDAVINQYLESVSGDNLDFEDELDLLGTIFSKIADKAKSVDPTLESKILAEGTKMNKQVDQLTSRVKRSAKQKEETAVNQITKTKEKLFPGGGLQERKVCFMEVLLKQSPSIIDDLVPAFDPLEKTMVVVEE